VPWAPIALLAASVVSLPIGAAVGEQPPRRTLPTKEATGKCGGSSPFASDHAVAAGTSMVRLPLVTHGPLTRIGMVAALTAVRPSGAMSPTPASG
jgi:hypothetical protein